MIYRGTFITTFEISADNDEEVLEAIDELECEIGSRKKKFKFSRIDIDEREEEERDYDDSYYDEMRLGL